MKIRILASASRDLVEGYRFYESQAEGVGAYFLDSLFADIDSLVIKRGYACRAFREISSPVIEAIPLRGLLSRRRSSGVCLRRARLQAVACLDQKEGDRAGVTGKLAARDASLLQTRPFKPARCCESPMANIFPSDWRSVEATGAAQREIETLAKLEQALPDAYTVYHGVHWTRVGGGFSMFGEMDFVVVNPWGSMLLIEQKPGFLQEAADGW